MDRKARDSIRELLWREELESVGYGDVGDYVL